MHFIFTPADRDQKTIVAILDDRFMVDGKDQPLSDLDPELGLVTVEYSAIHRMSLSVLTKAHSYRIIPSDVPPPEPVPEPEPDPDSDLQAWRETTVAKSYAIAIILGKDRWLSMVEWFKDDFVISILIEKTLDIPRISETVELLRWFFSLSQEQTDDVFRAAQAVVK